MAVAFDAVANLGTGNTSSGVSGYLTLGGSATGLLVAVGGYIPGSGNGYGVLTTHTVTIGASNTPLTLVASVDCDNYAGYGWVQLYELLAPSTGSQQIVVKAAKGTTYAYLNATAISFTGLGQFGTPVINYGSATTATTGSVGIVSATGNRVLNIMGGFDATFTSPSGTSRSNMPSPAVSNYVTLLVQDAPGAASVTETATFSGYPGWGCISINLIAGSLWNVGSTLAMSLTEAVTASFVGRVWNVGATLALSLTLVGPDYPVTFPVPELGWPTATAQAYGPALRYVGREPDTDSSLVTASYAEQSYTNTLVTPTWLTQQITSAAANLVTATWVSQQIAPPVGGGGYLTQSQVTTTLAGYVPANALGPTSPLVATGGAIAESAGDGTVPPGQLPTLVTNNLATVYDCYTSGSVYLMSSQTFTVTTSVVADAFPIAEIVVPNPGYPWIAFPFAYVLGYSSDGSSGSNLFGNANFGRLVVTAGSTIYAEGLMTDDTVPNYYTAVPCADLPSATAPITPQTQTPIVGGLTLTLGACNYESSGYTVSGNGLLFYVLVLPAMGAM